MTIASEHAPMNLQTLARTPAVPGASGEPAPDSYDALAKASVLAEIGRLDEACDILDAEASRAASSPSRAMWLLRLALLERDRRGVTARVESALRQAVDASADADDATLKAHVRLSLGESLLDLSTSPDAGTDVARSRTQESIRWHQQAERLFRAAGDVEHAALCQINTAVAYLSMCGPASGPSRLKPKIAVQCLRAALAGLDRELHAELWESAMLNLANALQQTPTSSDAADLLESIAIYEELLTVRAADADPSSRGRVLANLGCALGRLARFDDADARLNEALACFDGEPEAIEGVRATLDELRAARASAAPERRP